jgi:hypothetical protein
MTGELGMLLAQGVPLAPPLNVRLIALFVIEVALLALVVLLYVRWVQLKNQPLDEWWAGRKAEGLAPTTLVEIEESERERRARAGGGAARPRAARPPRRGALRLTAPVGGERAARRRPASAFAPQPRCVPRAQRARGAVS